MIEYYNHPCFNLFAIGFVMGLVLTLIFCYFFLEYLRLQRKEDVVDNKSEGDKNG